MSESLKTIDPTPQAVMLALAFNYFLPCALHVAAELGIADHFADGPKRVDELATATATHPPSLYRLLRMLAGHGIFLEDPSGDFQLTPLAATLQTGVAGSVRDAVRLAGDASWWNAAGHLLHTVRTGEPAFKALNGSEFYEYLAKNPSAALRFNRGMANGSSIDNAAIAQCYDFGQFRRIVDVGGGQGGFIGAVLKAYPTVVGVLYDQPHVVREPAYVTALGVLDRCEIIGGNFFEAVPRGADCYVIKQVLWDWNDEKCVTLLNRCRESMAEKGRVLILEPVLPAQSEPRPIYDWDIMMMALEDSRTRTEQDFHALYQQAGLKVTRIVPTPSSGLMIIEGERA